MTGQARPETDGTMSPFHDDVGDASPDPFEAMYAVDPEGAEALRAEWGDDFERNVEFARTAAGAFAHSGAIDALVEAGIGDDPRVVRVAAEIGRLLQGGTGGTGDEAGGGGTRDALEEELDALVRDPDYWSERVQRRVRQIYRRLYGDAAAPVHRMPGDAGRAG